MRLAELRALLARYPDDTRIFNDDGYCVTEVVAVRTAIRTVESERTPGTHYDVEILMLQSR